MAKFLKRKAGRPISVEAGRSRRGQLATNERRDRSGEVERIDGLRQKRLETEIRHALGCVAVPMRGDCDHRDAAAVFALELADLPEQPETVLAWHRQVRYDCVQAYRLHDGQRVPR